MKLLKLLKKAWDSIPDEEKEDRRTRWVLTLLAFLMLSLLMSASFVASLLKSDTEVALALIDLTKHLSYVFGSIVAVYYGIESIWPSSDRPYGGWGGGMGWGRRYKANEPAVGPNSEDAQVD